MGNTYISQDTKDFEDKTKSVVTGMIIIMTASLFWVAGIFLLWRLYFG